MAWTEKDRRQKLLKRRERVRYACDILPPGSASADYLLQQPLFCFETAVKLVMWAGYAYQVKPQNPKTLKP